ncbi:MAG: hypothetical protein FJX68_05885 [Alphaproteobacteria bacterium]|nr:hypothetical protein [Alphaproteobacteria bacterium]
MDGLDPNTAIFLGLNLVQLICVPLSVVMFVVATYIGVRHNGDRPEFIAEQERAAREAAEIAQAKFAELGLQEVIPKELLPEFARDKPSTTAS